MSGALAEAKKPVFIAEASDFFENDDRISVVSLAEHEKFDQIETFFSAFNFGNEGLTAAQQTGDILLSQPRPNAGFAQQTDEFLIGGGINAFGEPIRAHPRGDIPQIRIPQKRVL
jgi:hypothetical protein